MNSSSPSAALPSPSIHKRGPRPSHLLLPLLSVAVFAIAAGTIIFELREFHYRDVERYLGQLSSGHLIAALFFTTLSYLTLTLYDVLGVRYGGHPLPYRKTALASFISYAVNNTVAMSGLVGGSLRYRLYSAWGLTTTEIAKVIGFTIATFWLGFITLAGAALTFEPVTIPAALGLPSSSSRPLGMILLVGPILYIALVARRRSAVKVGRWSFPLPPIRIALAQILISTIDWLFVAVALHSLLRQGSEVPFFTMLSAFLLAQLLGVISNVPGGVGVFEAVLIALLHRSVGSDVLAGTLIAFRAIYYLVPLGAAGLMLAGYEFLRRRRGFAAVGRGVARAAGLFIPSLFSIATFVTGVILLISGATPAERLRIEALRMAVPLPLVEISHLLASMTGAGLLLLARGLQRRLNGAYVLSAALLAAAIVFSLLKGLDYEEAALLALVLLALIPCRSQFYRQTALVNEKYSAGWIAAILMTLLSTFWIGFFAFRRVEYAHELWWNFSFAGGDASRFLRASVAVSAVLLAFSMRKLLRPARSPMPTTSDEDLTRAEAIARGTPASASHLALLGDKRLLFDDERRAFVMYQVQGRSWVAMGDPVGPKEVARELAWKFYEEADRHNGWPVFYQVRRENLPLFVELGLTLLKFGEEARIGLKNFSLTGQSRKGLRHSVRRVEEEGVEYELVAQPAVRAILPELRAVSDDWLSGKQAREKRFSMGSFEEEYVARFPVAIARRGGAIVAFANVWGDTMMEELTIDLMRHTHDAPRAVMDFLFVRLMEWGRDRGYRWFNLGMAPLAGLEARKQGPLWARMAMLGFEHGERFYNFQGVRQYKEKFGPVWEPVYIAMPGGFKLPLILGDIASLISGGMRGIVAP